MQALERRTSNLTFLTFQEFRSEQEKQHQCSNAPIHTQTATRAVLKRNTWHSNSIMRGAQTHRLNTLNNIMHGTETHHVALAQHHA